MTNDTPTTTSTTPTTALRVGLGLSILLGLSNLPFLIPMDSGDFDAPPYALLVLSAIIGMVSVVTAVIAWNTGNRTAIRIDAAALIINALTIVPAVFFDVPGAVKVVSVVTVVLTVIAVYLLLRREPVPTTVTD